MTKTPFITADKLDQITAEFPTPFHLYDEKGIRETARAVNAAFSWNPGFKEFFANMGDKDILKAEYLLPIYIDELLQAGRVSVKVLDTNDKWFGVTYREDKDYVVKSFAKLIEDGVYQKGLFEDLK